jgi:hypothetical protein
MRIVTFSAAAAIAVLASDAFAQTATPEGYTGAYQPAGTPPTTPYSTGPLPKEDSGPGRDVEDPDGSTKTVKAVPCSTAAHGTDGTTTSIGTPGPIRAGHDSREGSTVGRSRR